MNTIASTILSLVVSQMNPTVGDIEGNTEKIIATSISARDDLKADLVIFPESSIAGYPPYDIPREESYYMRISQAIDKLKDIQDITMVVGIANHDSNQVMVINNGTVEYEYCSVLNKGGNYRAESNFAKNIALYKYKNSKIGFLIGDDINNTDILYSYKNCNADLLISLNSPVFYLKNYDSLIDYAKKASKITNSPVVCSCLVGSQDQFIFTGGSIVIDKQQKIAAQAKYLQEQLLPIEFIEESKNIVGKIYSNVEYNSIEMLYSCLVVSLRDYVYKNGFNKVVLGLSGGIDSAVTATIAVDALGKDNVIAVMMPYKYTSPKSIELAEKLAENLGIELKTIPIHEIYNTVSDKLISACNVKIKSERDSGNVQARLRALLLMTIANTHNAIVLNTGNKSEIATGYFTMYGDGIGGFSVLADVFKTIVYFLADYRNQKLKIIPSEIITREPTAELYSGQLDRNDLPAYKTLDQIIQMHLEEESIEDIMDETYTDRETVRDVLMKINRAEYKRSQLPIGPLVEYLGFDKTTRDYPITNKWTY
jgi:NAD+ synthase (glutamine-hydrolysing)